MKPFSLTTALAIILAFSADVFAGRSVTLYLDGARVEQSEIARKGYLEITVPAGAARDSLRIAPGKGVEILRVVTAPLQLPKSIEAELGKLAEREELLNARLKALSVREEIFKSAAKSQSAKAPRRTKTNPEPLSTIRQGTDYAITQLESVYQAKRKAEKELAQIAGRRSLLGKDELSGGNVARVWLTPASGSVTAVWIQSDRRWTPAYQLRVDDKGSAVISLAAQGITLAKGETADLVLATLQSAGHIAAFRYENSLAILKKEEFKVTSQPETGHSPFMVSLTNSSGLNLPPGDISCFKSGVYMGIGIFQGVDVGKPIDIVCGGK
jgi:hypothetical protein